MANLEVQKRNEAREYSENLLQRLASTVQKRHTEDESSDAPLNKICFSGMILYLTNIIKHTK